MDKRLDVLMNMLHHQRGFTVHVSIPDGSVYEFPDAYLTGLSVETVIDGTVVVSGDIRGACSRFACDEWNKHVNRPRRSGEWMCNYCNSPNDYKERHCSQCGATRSFIYE